MKCKALVVECLFTEMCLLSLGEGLIFHQVTVFTYTCGFASTWYNVHASPNMAHTAHAATYWLMTLFPHALLRVLAPLWSIKSLTAILTELMRVSDYEVLVASVRRSCSSCGKSKESAVCKLHPQGQRWQTTSRDQTGPTVKHKPRCFSLINTSSFPLVNTTARL